MSNVSAIPAKKPTILYVANDYDFFLAHRLPFAEEAKKQGYNVIFATPPPPKLKPEEHHGISFIPLKLIRKGRMPITELNSFVHLYNLYKEIRPDIVHHFTIKPVVYGSLAAKILKLPYVINTITGLGSIYIQKNFINFLTQVFIGAVYRFSFHSQKVKVIFQNPDDKDLFLSKKYVTTEQCKVILGSGVDIERFKPTEAPPTIPIILYPGRLLWDKGLGDLIEAGKLLNQKGYQFEIHACGPIDTMNPSGIPEEVIKEWENFKWFKWLGVRSDMPTVFANAHIICLPSYREGVPIALLEASASAKPIVTTDAPGCREVVVQHHNGYKIPTHNPTSLAMRIAKLLDNPELQIKMGQEGREIAVKKFSRKNVIQEVMNVYNEVLPEISG